jgi:hypothetical protein
MGAPVSLHLRFHNTIFLSILPYGSEQENEGNNDEEDWYQLR